MTDTPGTLEELEMDLHLARLGDYPGVKGVKRMADEIASLRARVEAAEQALAFDTGSCASLNLQGALDDLQGRHKLDDGGVIERTLNRVIGQIEAARQALKDTP